MRGAYYVAIALLVAANSRTAAESNQAKPQQALNNDFVTSSGKENEMLPRQVFRKSRELKSQKLAGDAGDEERMVTGLSEVNSLKEFEQTILKAATVLKTNEDDEIAKAAETLVSFMQLKPALKFVNSKPRRIDPAPRHGGGKVLHATPNMEKSLVPVANKAPFASAKRLGKDKPRTNMNGAAKSITQHDDRLAPSDSFTIEAVVPDGRPNKQLVAQKASTIDMDTHPDDMEIRQSKRQRIESTTDNVDGLALHALPNSEKALVSVTNIAPTVLAKRLKEDVPTVVMVNAVNCIAHHDFRPVPSGSSTTSAATLDGRLNNHEKLLFDLNKLPGDVDPHLVGRPLNLPEENEEYAHTAMVNGQASFENWEAILALGPVVGPKDKVTEEVEKIHEGFLKALNLPFHQYLRETALMLRLLRWRVNSSPNNINTANTLKDLAYSQKPDDIIKLLDTDLAKLLGDGESAVEATEENLKEAYSVKLLIMYELFHDFCHGNKKLVGKLPSKSDRVDSILELTT